MMRKFRRRKIGVSGGFSIAVMPPSGKRSNPYGDLQMSTATIIRADDVEAFLEFLFGNVALPPKEVTLRETASVVRYLRMVAQAGVPRYTCEQGPNAVRQYRLNRGN